MKTQNGISISSLDLQNTRINQTQRPSYGQNSNTSVSFENLLETRLNQIGQNKTLPEKMPPIDGNQLAQMAATIEKQMNDFLFKVFGETEIDPAANEVALNGIGLPGLKSFQNTQSPFVRKPISPQYRSAIPSRPDIEETIDKASATHRVDTDLVKAVQNTPAPVLNKPIAPQHRGTVPSRSEIEEIINTASATHGVDPDLIKAVVKAESDFNPGSTSSKGAMGLMQLMPATARDLGVQNPYNPVENIHAGARYLKQLLNRYDGDKNLALSAYNWGMGNVERNPGKLPHETRTYITRINRYYHDAKQKTQRA